MFLIFRSKAANKIALVAKSKPKQRRSSEQCKTSSLLKLRGQKEGMSERWI